MNVNNEVAVKEICEYLINLSDNYTIEYFEYDGENLSIRSKLKSKVEINHTLGE